MGRPASASPARARLTAWPTRRTASSWPITRWRSLSSMFRIFWRSPSSIRVAGMPVQSATTRATCTGSTAPSSSRSLPWASPQLRLRRRPRPAPAPAACRSGSPRRCVRSPARSAVVGLLAGVAEGPVGLVERGDGAQLGLPLGAQRAQLAAHLVQRRRQLAPPLGRLVVLLPRQRPQLQLQRALAPGQLVDLVGVRIQLQPQPAARLVQQIDGLVGQRPAGDVAAPQLHRRHQRPVVDAHPVLVLVAPLHPAQHGHRLVLGRLLDHHRQEAPLERRILLDVQAVLVDGGGADAGQLAPGQRRLQQIGGVQRPVALAGADEGVDLVEEQQHRPARLAHLGQQAADAVLELAPQLGPGDQRADVQAEDALVGQPAGHVAVGDADGQPLDHRRLAHAGIADEDGVVLAPPPEDLQHPAGLGVAADDGIHLARRRLRRQIAGVFGQQAAGRAHDGRGPVAAGPAAAAASAPSRAGLRPRRLPRRRGAPALALAGASPRARHHLFQLGQRQPRLAQHLGRGRAGLERDPDQQVQRRHHAGAALARLDLGDVQQRAAPGRPGTPCRSGPWAARAAPVPAAAAAVARSAPAPSSTALDLGQVQQRPQQVLQLHRLLLARARQPLGGHQRPAPIARTGSRSSHRSGAVGRYFLAAST